MESTRGWLFSRSRHAAAGGTATWPSRFRAHQRPGRPALLAGDLEGGEDALLSRARTLEPLASLIGALARSILHSFEACRDLWDWKVGTHGVTIVFTAVLSFCPCSTWRYSATLLPEVIKEEGLSQEADV